MGNPIYRETVVSRLNIAIFAVAVGFLSLAFIYQLTVGPFGTRPASNEIYLFMIMLFLAIGITFSRLTIVVTDRGVVVGYGIIRQAIPWDNIEGVYPDQTSAVWYGGWGIRLGRVGGKWRRVYNVVGAPRVVLSLRRGKREFAFSTRHPEQVIKVITGNLEP